MKQKTTLLLVGCVLMLVTACNTREEEQFKKSQLELALDSAEVLYLFPQGVSIVKREMDNVLAEENARLKMKGLRIIAQVLLSKEEPSTKDLNAAVSFAVESRKLALSAGDSVEWALSTIQIFRYEQLKRTWGLVSSKIGEKEELRKALHILERENPGNELSLGYRTLARTMSLDGESTTMVLNYDLLSLQFNDSLRYPRLRVKICLDIAESYSFRFLQKDLAERFYWRASEIFRHMGDSVSYTLSLYNLAIFAKDMPDSVRLRYLNQAAAVAGTNGLTVMESYMYFLTAQRFQAIGMFDSALYYLQNSIQKLPKTLENYRAVVNQRESLMAESFANTGDTKRARRLALHLEDTLKVNPNLNEVEANTILNELIHVYGILGDFEKLSDMQHRLMALQDSMYSTERFLEVGKIENRYASELKERQLQSLQIANKLRAVEAERESKVRLLLIGIVIISVIGFAVVRSLLKRQNKLSEYLIKQNSTIENQKVSLENALGDLQRTQAHIFNSEKMAMLGQFTAGVAHELNNPLNFVSGGVSVLEEAADAAKEGVFKKEQQLLRNIRHGVDQAIGIVKSLRVFSNPRSEIGFDAHANIAECMSASLLVLQSKIQTNNVKIVCDVSDFTVVGHSGQLCQVFINLIDNAIYAVRDLPNERKIIEILARTTNSKILIDFKDNGAGIDDYVKPNIFRPFFTTKPTGQGIGLGLFICNTIISGIGGTITFTSGMDQTIFTVELARPK